MTSPHPLPRPPLDMDLRASVTPTQPAGTQQSPRRLDSSDLLDGAQLVLIVHQGETYRLQTTRQGKLILTK